MVPKPKPTFLILVGAGDWNYKATERFFFGSFVQDHQRRNPTWLVVMEHESYWPWQKKKIHAYAERLVKHYDEGRELVILGHSLGGVIASYIIAKFRKSRVKAVIQLFAPIRIASWWGMDNQTGTPLLSYLDVLDPLVIFPLSYNAKATQTYVTFPRLHCWCKPSSIMLRQIKDFLEKHSNLRMS